MAGIFTPHQQTFTNARTTIAHFDAYMHTHIHACMYAGRLDAWPAPMHINLHTYMHTHRASPRAYTRTRIQAATQARHACIHTVTHAYLHQTMRTYIHTYIGNCIHDYTNTHRSSLTQEYMHTHILYAHSRSPSTKPRSRSRFGICDVRIG